MRYWFKLLALMLIALCVNCRDDNWVPKTFPFMIGTNVNVDGPVVTLFGEVRNPGTVPVKSYGFVVNGTDEFDVHNMRPLQGRSFAKGEYQLTINSGLQRGMHYYARPYAETEERIVYGDLLEFVASGPPPQIISFTPAEGGIGTPVVITGTNFGNLPHLVRVWFGDTEASVDAVSDNEIHTSVPNSLTNLHVKISVQVEGTTIFSDGYFDILYPWTRMADFPGTYLRLIASFVAKDRLYVLGGLRINPWQVMNEFWMYNPATNLWIQKQDFPGTMRYDAIAFSCKDKGYYGLGRTESQYLSDFWEYDADTEEWTRMEDFPQGSPSQPKAFSASDKGFVGLGYNYSTGQGFTQYMWQYDPATSHWTQIQDFPSAGRYPGFSLGVGSHAYFGLGTNGWQLNDIYKYDPVAGSWDYVTYYPGTGWNDVGGFFIDGNIYMGMGSNNGSDSFSDFWKFQLADGAWEQMPPCPTKLSPAVAVTIGGKGYIGYGWYDLSWNDEITGRAFYQFDPARQ